MLAKMWNKEDFHALLMGTKTIVFTLENWLVSALLQVTQQPLSSLRTCSTELWMCVNQNLCTRMFTAALFVIALQWKQRTCPSGVEWINNCPAFK